MTPDPFAGPPLHPPSALHGVLNAAYRTRVWYCPGCRETRTDTFDGYREHLASCAAARAVMDPMVLEDLGL